MTVDCEDAANLISSRIDGELAAADAAALDAHLGECAACRAAMESCELQDAAMLRAFAGGRDAA
jgi:predicted anti-sigma-YlaC factor YlaD